MKVTVPVAVGGVTVAVKVTGEPYDDGLADEVSATVVFAAVTVCVSVGEMLLL